MIQTFYSKSKDFLINKCDFQNVVKEEDEELNRLLAQDVDAKPEKVLGDDTGHLPYTIFRKKINKSVFNFKQM